MYLKHLRFQHYGPIEMIDLALPFDSAGKPIPLVLVGVNGSGKSIVLSTILDALVTMRSSLFNESKDTRTGKLFKPLTHRIRAFGTAQLSSAECDFDCSKGTVTFTEIAAESNPDGTHTLPESVSVIPNFEHQRFGQTGLSKSLSVPAELYRTDMTSDVVAYYPAGRAERPSWIGVHTPISFETSALYIDEAKYPVWRSHVLPEIERWVLDVVLDAELYDREPLEINGTKHPFIYMPVVGRNRRMITHLNNILGRIISQGNPSFQSARVAISERRAGARSVQLRAKRNDGEEVLLANQLSDLSTGELMVFCMFADIVRIAELQGWDRNELKSINGIVLIDEVDLHLHIKLQKSLLPDLIAMMPGVQFIMSTHSPFLALGFAETSINIICMPEGVNIHPSEFSEFNDAYEIFITQNERFKDEYAALRKAMDESGRPLIVTEGKTDWQHLKMALFRLKQKGEFLDLDVSFHQSDSDMGSGELKKLFDSIVRLQPVRPLICMFDRDEERYVKEFAGNDDGCLVRGTVAGACLAVPKHRTETPSICIEHCYTDVALSTAITGTDKRLRFMHEIGFEQDRKTAFLRPTPKGPDIKIFDGCVGNLGYEDGSRKGELAITKNSFLTEIVLSQEGESFDLEGFRPTFELLRSIVGRVKSQPAKIVGGISGL